MRGVCVCVFCFFTLFCRAAVALCREMSACMIFFQTDVSCSECQTTNAQPNSPPPPAFLCSFGRRAPINQAAADDSRPASVSSLATVLAVLCAFTATEGHLYDSHGAVVGTALSSLMGIAEAVPESSAQAECVKAALVALKECAEVNHRRLKPGKMAICYMGNCWRGGGVFIVVIVAVVVVVARRACSARRLLRLFKHAHIALFLCALVVIWR